MKTDADKEFRVAHMKCIMVKKVPDSEPQVVTAILLFYLLAR